MRALKPADLEPLGSAHAARLEVLGERVGALNGHRDPMAVHAPLTGETLGFVPRCSAEEVVLATRRARAIQREWALLSVGERAQVLLRFHDLVLSRQREVLDIIQLENGKTRIQAFEEVIGTATAARYYGHAAARHLRPQRRQGAFPLLTSTEEVRRPRGLVGFIVPWNYPLVLGITDALPALVAGNGVIIKPDEKTPYSTLWAVELLEQAGLPEGLAQVVTGEGAELGSAIVDNVDFVMFTGSTRVGKLVAARAAERLIEYSMELGGKNAMLVLDDADVARAVEVAATATFSNAGQLCVALERIYIHGSVYEEFVSRYVERTRKLRLGAGLDWKADVGCMMSAQQLDRVKEHVRDAVEKGAKVLAGARARPDIGPLFYEPTILEGVTEGMELCREETFGPVVSVYRVDSAEEGLELINDSRYGLNASIWTRNVPVGRALAERIEAGTVNVNEGYAAAFGSTDAPMGGFKQSGVGRRHGEYGIRKYTEAQTIAVQRLIGVLPPMGANGRLYSSALTLGLRMMRRIPGIR
jgi:succinate-semialdehyde dehydrogenase / glutarate-semialdehyde dehydrogenase